MSTESNANEPAADHEPVDVVARPAIATKEVGRPDPNGGGRRSWSGLLVAVLAVMLLVVLILQVTIMSTLADQKTDLADVSDAIVGVEDNVAQALRQLDVVDGRLGAIEGNSIVAPDTGGVSPSATPTVAGGLPIFETTQNDPAVVQQMVLGDVTGTEYYSGEQRTYAPTDGKARVWIVWAHWCPYCQQELPVLSQWHAENSARLVNTELVSVTTSIDESRPNPLLPYLDEQDFSFPVLVDPDLSLALQFGVSAYPYWVVTDQNGVVVLRVAGLLELSQVDSLFTELETLAAGA